MKLKKALLVIFTGATLFSCTNKQYDNPQKVVFTVSHPWDYQIEKEMVYLNIEELAAKYGSMDMSHYNLYDLNTNKQIEFNTIKSNGEKKGEFLAFEMPVIAREPIRPFELKYSEIMVSHTSKEAMAVENKLKVTFLKECSQATKDTTHWSTTVANTFMELYPKPEQLEAFAPGVWSYTNGLFVNALCELSEKTGDSVYLNYSKRWVDHFVNDEGVIAKYNQQKYRLDDVLPARTLLYVYKKWPEEKYAASIANFLDHLENQPKTEEGGYWHKKMYEHQMWLDGIYMADVFTSQYAKMFDRPEAFEEALLQIKLIYKRTKDPKTGLLFHGWDESKQQIWANAETGTSPEFWGRGMGWYMMALVDVLGYLPEDHPERGEVLAILKELSAAIAKYQDPENGLWYQVVDEKDKPGNWIETSCSAMFAYAFAKGQKNGYLPDEYMDKAKKAFSALVDGYVYFDNANHFYLTRTVKVGTLNPKNSDGSYDYYINVDCRINDFKGTNAFLYLAMELEY